MIENWMYAAGTIIWLVAWYNFYFRKKYGWWTAWVWTVLSWFAAFVMLGVIRAIFLI